MILQVWVTGSGTVCNRDSTPLQTLQDYGLTCLSTGYHVPGVRKRDAYVSPSHGPSNRQSNHITNARTFNSYYAQLEQARIEAARAHE